MKRTLIPTLVAATLAAVPAAAQPAKGAGPTVAQPCAACHLPTGVGVPGAFPPLRGNVQSLAATPQGRRYLVLVVTHGLSGTVTIEGKRYSGVMPAQTLKDDAIARVLNGILSGGQRPFTTKEVTQLRAGGAKLGPADVAKLRPVTGQ